MGIYSDMDLMQSYQGSVFSSHENQSAFDEPDDADGVPATFAADTPPAFASEPPVQETATPATTLPQTTPTSAETAGKPEEDEETKRRAHEEAEAKRKAEWEAKQQEKKAAKQAQLDRIAAMSDDEIMADSMKRIGTETERLTRRNMKECIAEYIQTLCLSDLEFARMVLHPGKSMIHCIWYINRKAREYVEQEMKDNDIKPDRNGIYGSDVPDDLCYQWSEDYFRDPNAKEDQEEEEKFVPKPYVGKGSSKANTKSKTKKEPTKKAESKKPPEPKPEPPKGADAGQMTLGDFGMLGESA